MNSIYQRDPNASLFLGGERQSGADVRNQNGMYGLCGKIFLTYAVLATQTIANIVKSSLGPVGLDKMLVDDIGVGVFRQVRERCSQL